jgi:hypothetical protein
MPAALANQADVRHRTRRDTPHHRLYLKYKARPLPVIVP